MGLKRTRKIAILLAIDATFFLVEIVVGSATHSLALIADSFHMLNDVFSLIIALWAIKLARERKSCSKYTYGWQRAEVLGALINGVFLLALCLSIFLEAIQRFFEPQVITKPPLVLGVGCAGLASNLIGLALFSHSHDHGHGHGHDHPPQLDEESHATHAHTHGEHGHHDDENDDADRVVEDHGDIRSVLPQTVVQREFAASYASPGNVNAAAMSWGGRRRNSSVASRPRRFADPDRDIGVHPSQHRKSIVQYANNGRPGYSSSTQSDDEVAVVEATETSPMITKGSTPTYDTASPCVDWSKYSNGHTRHDSWHKQHNHMAPKDSKKSDHSHQDLNMRGVFLHVLGDAVGNIGVILVALFIWLTDFSWRYYMDPVISLVIVVIITSSALPLCKASAMILLQGVPKGISLDDVKEDIASIPGIVDVHELHIWQLSDVKMIASVHVRVAFDPRKGDTEGLYMELARGIRQCLHAYGIHSSTIQPEYVPASKAPSLHASGSDSTAVEASGSLSPPKQQKLLCGGYGTVQGPGADEEGRCLLDCGAECETGKCCGPVSEDAAGNMGHHH